ncbi:ArsR/SmtB family transcription factor [Virgibacillus doumboii]|uniref:ArsR/SmtB family transcription factor n=1 Tax=Virgibacillus doumboii TaxID=2697503 RepID=UPI0013DEB9FE|nr:helix-turn-helix domain-containing protein [Virgibacillus doumboii]
MRTPFHPSKEDIHFSSVMHALSEPIRLNIVRELLLDPSADCSEMYTDMPKSTRSHHFRVLRESGVTRTEVNGSLHHVSLRHEDLNTRFPGLLDTIAKANEPL